MVLPGDARDDRDRPDPVLRALSALESPKNELSDANLMPHFIRCAERYATLGEQTQVLREVFGEYREPVAV